MATAMAEVMGHCARSLEILIEITGAEYHFQYIYIYSILPLIGYKSYIP